MFGFEASLRKAFFIIVYSLTIIVADIMKKPFRSFDELIAFRVLKSDRAALRRVAEKLELDQSEIVRRAFRTGLQILDKAQIPGSSHARGE